MPTLAQFLSQAKTITIATSGPRVERTIAEELVAGFARSAGISTSPGVSAGVGSIRVGVVADRGTWRTIHPSLQGDAQWAMLRAKPGSGMEILASAPHLLFWIYSFAAEDWHGEAIEKFADGRILHPVFPSFRPSYDSFLTQHNRTIKGLNRDEHIRNMARLGFSHAEVNGLAFAVPFERGPKGEVLHRFYTYCPALDQFVTSFLNKGIYDFDYIQANLNSLKTNAEIAEKYGLRSGITCFEPRSVPDALLERYPMLRGARVDHPIRSWHPRFNLSIAHPVVRDHYAEMMENLLREVPQIDYMAVWSNDSGAGFEYTSSLYVGRNGGGYVIREWKGDKEIAEAAANNLVRFHRTLRDAGRKVNPRFRTLLRLEAFTAELDHIWRQLEDGIDVEANSLVSKGWDVDYHHPKYRDRRPAAGTALFNAFAPEEKGKIDDLHAKRAEADVYFSAGAVWNHEPLLGIPFPRLVYEKLIAMTKQQVSSLAFSGGTTPRSMSPYNINEELVRAFQADRTLNFEEFLKRKATEWYGQSLAGQVVSVWLKSDEAYRAFPVPVQIYSGWGVWYRLFTRPIIPDIEKVSEKDREYYEQFLLAPPHNRCRVDFRYDVGFDLIEPAQAQICLDLINANVMPEVEEALTLAEKVLAGAKGDAEKRAAVDLRDRMFAMKCWYRNQRNVTAWLAGVHQYLETKEEATRNRCRKILREMVLDEIDNTRALLKFTETSTTPWMILSDVGETTFIYYKNIREHLKRKIELMQGHENDEPYIDPDFQWRVPGITPEKQR
jgi:hypothetical protein